MWLAFQASVRLALPNAAERIISFANRLLVFMLPQQTDARPDYPFPRRIRGDSKPIYVKRLLAVPTHRALGLCWSR
jgi:hypothetical protein